MALGDIIRTLMVEMLDIDWSGQFQFDEKLSPEGKLDDLLFSESPSSPSSDEFGFEVPLTLPILDPIDTNTDAFLIPLFSDTVLDSQAPLPKVPSSFSVPYPSGKRPHDAISEKSDSLRSHKGKKIKVDGNTKRERNKVSAAKYRQRRKVYIDGLEDHVRQLNEQLEAQSKTIASLKTENQMLKDQVSYLKKLVDGFRCGKPLVQSIPPINRLVKPEISKALKPMGAGLFLLAICCLVFSFQPENAGGHMSPLPVRTTSRTLLHHEDDYNDSAPFVPMPLEGPSETEPPPNVIETVVVETTVDTLNAETSFEGMESIVTRHECASAAAA